MNYNRISVYSHEDFDTKMYRLGIDNTNVNAETDKAFISIMGTKECLKHYNEEHTSHWFNGESDNVLNVDFDDIDGDVIEWKGHTFYGITDAQAEECVDFIEKNIGKHFYIHCRAGKSRSQAVCQFILDMYGKEFGYDKDFSCRKENPCKTPNIRVLTMLKRAYYNKNGMFNND